MCLLLLFVPFGHGVGIKDRLFHRGWGMGVKVLIRIIIITAGQSDWEVFCFCWGVGRWEVATCWCGQV